MAGSTFFPGEQKIRPGVFIRVTNVGEPQQDTVPQGIAAAVFQADWGPLGEVQILESKAAGDALYRSGNLACYQEEFRGGCRQVVAYRVGAGGQKASVVLKNELDADAVTITGKYVGTHGNKLAITLEADPNDATKKVFSVYEDGILREQYKFTAGEDEIDRLIAAIPATSLITATKVDGATGALKDYTSLEPLLGGQNPTVTTTDYTNALNAIETKDWNELAVDSDDPAIHAVVKEYIDRVRAEGKRVRATVGEPTSVTLATRLTNAAAFNDYAIKYVANGFKLADGSIIEGWKAAARIAGMSAAASVTTSLTHAVIAGAVEVVGALTNAQIEQAIQSGAIVFSTNAAGQVQVEYDINTFVTPDAEHDAGWKKNRRVRTRDTLIGRIAATWDTLIGKVNNDKDGRATLIAAAQGIIDDMIAEGALLPGGTIYEDPANPPSGDQAWFICQVDDVDSAEKLYITFGFRFTP